MGIQLLPVTIYPPTQLAPCTSQGGNICLSWKMTFYKQLFFLFSFRLEKTENFQTPTECQLKRNKCSVTKYPPQHLGQVIKKKLSKKNLQFTNLFVIVCVCVRDVCCTYHSTHTVARGYILGLVSLLLPCVHSGDAVMLPGLQSMTFTPGHLVSPYTNFAKKICNM